MAKGRRFGAERLLGTCGYESGQMIAGPEYQESEMWSGSIESDSDSDRTGWPPSQEDRNMGGLSIAFSGIPSEKHRPAERPHVVASSAPVNVPDWTRFRRFEPVVEPEVEWSIGNNDEAREWDPPHVYLAKGNATGGTSSVFEGIGRTLKGRDMSRVRNAVWNQTGFFG